MKIAFFDTKKYDKKYFDKYNSTHIIKYFEMKLNIDSVTLAKGYDAVCVFVNDEITKEVLEKLKEFNINIVALRCAGFNNVNLKIAKALDIKIVRVPAYSPYAVAEHTIALILTLNRKIHKSYLRTREANFTLSGLTGFDLNGKTAGIIGTGKIALIVIKILKGFGMKVLAYDPYPNQEKSKELDFEYTTLNNLYKNSNIISLHCPLTKDTKYIINKNSIDKMKDGVMIVNTGRGALINTQDLINGLKSQKIGYAALDVYEEEGDYFFEDYSDTIISDDILARLLSFNNVLVTSHQAFLTEEALSNIAETTLKNFFEFENDLSLTNEVIL
ncbi:D-lactate dehydrogenase [Hypnocyclicus thermotrophus]|uniref:D-lactate dehydrogenase n=1 Tax=Hypnocyclicus thermotrophus TaxID=1627895 RepID=A0AA46DX64_9FUSO|nr:D-lactate dehydrogenase [Hypnocyclicus thermotrophus]